VGRPSAATVAPPPAKRRKPATKKRNPHASTQTRRPERRSSGQAPARKRPAGAATTAPRRVPQPRPGAATTTARPRSAPAAAPLVQRLIHGRTGALIDRLLRGRACVALVFVLLVGIVFFNVALLQLNEGIAQTNAKSTALEQQNAKLRRQVAPLASSERIQREAVKRGYSLPAAGDVGYIRGTTATNAKRAVARMTAPGMGDGTASRPAAQVEFESTASPTTPVATQTQTPQSATPQSAIPAATVP
jgi:cell division protein FtsL